MNAAQNSVPVIRRATKADLPAINRIYNYYVCATTSTFQLEPESDTGRLAWFKNHGETHPILAAELPGAGVIGWAALSAYSLRGGWRFTAEDSVYLHPAMHRRGIGKMLLAGLTEAARAKNFRTLVARICAEQTASAALHASVGFIEVGRLREVGDKFNRRLDVIYMQKML